MTETGKWVDAGGGSVNFEQGLPLVWDGLSTGLVNLILFGLVAAIRRQVHREGLSAFLLQGGRRGRVLFLQGALVGLLSFAAYPAIVILLGRGQLVIGEGSPWSMAGSTLAWGLGFLAVALLEEGLFRGYLLPKLAVRWPRWAAIGLPSLLFGALHIGSYGSKNFVWLGLVNAFLIGVVLSLVVLRSRSLMWAVGFHWAWNLTQETLLPEKREGWKTLVSLRAPESLWTGGSATPETGLIVTAIVVVLVVAVGLCPGRRWVSSANT